MIQTPEHPNGSGLYFGIDHPSSAAQAAPGFQTFLVPNHHGDGSAIRTCSNTRKVASAGSTQRAVDAAVALIAIPLLVMFGVLLESNMRSGDWITDPRARWHVLVLGLSLLFISLFVCVYVTHRLGICLWHTSHYDRFSVQSDNGSRDGGDCRMHILVSTELPPSYDSILNLDQPPPYCSIFIVNGRESTMKQETG